MNLVYTLFGEHWLLIASIVLAIFLLLVYFVYDMEKKKSLARPLIPKLLTRDWVEGRELRKQLKQNGVPMSGGLFYLLMSELAENKIVLSTDSTEVCEGEKLRIRYFKLP